MAQPTIKKRLKVKTMRTTAGADEAGGEAAAGSVGKATTSGVPAPRNPSYTVFAMLALIATLAFVGLVVLQWMEWDYYSPAFPKAVQTGSIGS